MRDGDGALALEWNTKVPISNGEHQTLVDRNGHFVNPTAVLGLMTPATLTAPSLHVEACADLEKAGSRTMGIGYRAVEWVPCEYGGNVRARYSIDTPWDNVAALRDHVDVDHGGGTIALGIVGLGFIAGGVALLALPKNCTAPCVLGAGSLLTLGAVIDIIAIGSLFTPSYDIIASPPSR